MAAEARLEARCCRYAERQGALAIKQRGGPAGTPDRAFLLPNGVTWWVEFKAPRGRASKRQEKMIGDMRDRMHLVSIVRTFDFFKVLYAILAGLQSPKTSATVALPINVDEVRQ